MSEQDLIDGALDKTCGLPKIICPDCKTEVYQVTAMPKAGDHIKADIFDPLNGYPKPQPADPVICPECGSPNILLAIKNLVQVL